MIDDTVPDLEAMAGRLYAKYGNRIRIQARVVNGHCFETANWTPRCPRVMGDDPPAAVAEI